MERRSCAPGFSWDSLLKHCISLEPVGLRPSSPITMFLWPSWKPVLSSGGPVEPAVSLSVWICVCLVMSGSLLVLLFWFIIYKHHNRTSRNTADEEDAHTAVSSQQEEDSKLQEVCGRSLCNGWAEHSLPLPATELGDSALVTTKTGQAAEV